MTKTGDLNLASIPPLLRAGVEHAWRRYTQACSQTPDNIAVAASRAELARVWAGSEFVATSCIQNPDLPVELITGGELDRPLTAARLTAAAADYFHAIVDEADLHRRLRRFRRRYMLCLAWRDLAGLADLKQTMHGVCALAEVCIQTALKWHSCWLELRFGTPRDEQGRAVHLVVVGLGKLGGGELNYSSDVDLMFAFSAAGATEAASAQQKSISNQEYYIKLGRQLIAALDAVTTDGFVFRTDLRLRPNGDSGPIALSFAAMEHYYQTHGRDWERYALIKARVVAGDPQAGSALLNMLLPFVYRRYLDFGAFDSLREMRQLIVRQLQAQDLQHDIKLGWGGIREVEFYVQSHQLIRGGREAGLRTTSLTVALHRLLKLGMVSAADHRALITAYRFLRNTEHRLQMVNDQQTQSLPVDAPARLRLAWSMGYDGWPQYAAQLTRHRAVIQGAFASVARHADTATAQQKALADVWFGVLEAEAAERALMAAGFDDGRATARLLGEFRRGRLYQSFSAFERERLDKLMPLALARAVGMRSAERAMRALVGVLESIGRRSAYLSLLIENPSALRQLLHLCAASPWVSRYIGQHPVILDELLQPPVDLRTQTDALLQQALEQRLVQVERQNVEGEMNVMREFMHAQVLRIAAADIDRVMRADQVMRALSQLAQALLNRVFERVLAVMVEKRGPPATQGGVVAYGKFASGELGYHSDLDLALYYRATDSTAINSDLDYFYSRVGQRFVHWLVARTYAGTLYTLDLRLRPGGRSGALAMSLHGLLDYQMQSAWTWEHQALVRARVVVGEAEFVQSFERVRRQILCQPRDVVQLRSAVSAMRARMVAANAKSNSTEFDIKLDYGGMVDIEFIIQFLILRHAHRQPDLVTPRTTAAQLTGLQEAGILSPPQTETLLTVYREYLRRSLYLKLMDRPVRIGRHEMREQRDQIKLLWSRLIG